MSEAIANFSSSAMMPRIIAVITAIIIIPGIECVIRLSFASGDIFGKILYKKRIAGTNKNPEAEAIQYTGFRAIE